MSAGSDSIQTHKNSAELLSLPSDSESTDFMQAVNAKMEEKLSQLLVNFALNEPLFDNELLFPTPTESEITHLNGQKLKSGTIEAIISHLTSPQVIDYQFLVDFFLTFRDYINALPLMELILCRLTWSLKKASAEDKQEATIGTLALVRTFVALRHWILNHFQDDFLDNVQLRQLFTHTLNEVSQFSIFTNSKDSLQTKVIIDLKKSYIRLCQIFWSTTSLDRLADVDFLKYNIQAHDTMPSTRLSTLGLQQLKNPGVRRQSVLSLMAQGSAAGTNHLLNEYDEMVKRESHSLEKLLKTRAARGNHKLKANNFETDKFILYPKASIYSLRQVAISQCATLDNIYSDILHDVKYTPVQGVKYLDANSRDNKENEPGFIIKGQVEVFIDSKVAKLAPTTPLKKVNVNAVSPKVPKYNTPDKLSSSRVPPRISHQQKQKKKFLKGLFHNSKNDKSHKEKLEIKATPPVSQPLSTPIAKDPIGIEDIKINPDSFDLLSSRVLADFESITSAYQPVALPNSRTSRSIKSLLDARSASSVLQLDKLNFHDLDDSPTKRKGMLYTSKHNNKSPARIHPAAISVHNDDSDDLSIGDSKADAHSIGSQSLLNAFGKADSNNNNDDDDNNNKNSMVNDENDEDNRMSFKSPSVTMNWSNSLELTASANIIDAHGVDVIKGAESIKSELQADKEEHRDDNAANGSNDVIVQDEIDNISVLKEDGIVDEHTDEVVKSGKIESKDKSSEVEAPHTSYVPVGCSTSEDNIVIGVPEAHHNYIPVAVSTSDGNVSDSKSAVDTTKPVEEKSEIPRVADDVKVEATVKECKLEGDTPKSESVREDEVKSIVENTQSIKSKTEVNSLVPTTQTRSVSHDHPLLKPVLQNPSNNSSTSAIEPTISVDNNQTASSEPLVETPVESQPEQEQKQEREQEHEHHQSEPSEGTVVSVHNDTNNGLNSRFSVKVISRNSIMSAKSYITYDSELSYNSQRDDSSKIEEPKLRKKTSLVDMRVVKQSDKTQKQSNTSLLPEQLLEATTLIPPLEPPKSLHLSKRRLEHHPQRHSDDSSDDEHDMFFDSFAGDDDFQSHQAQVDNLSVLKELPYFVNDFSTPCPSVVNIPRSKTIVSMVPSPTPSESCLLPYPGISSGAIAELAAIPDQIYEGNPLDFALSKLNGTKKATAHIEIGLNDEKDIEKELMHSPCKHSTPGFESDNSMKSIDEMKLEKRVRELFISHNPRESVAPFRYSAKLLKTDTRRMSKFDMNSLASTPHKQLSQVKYTSVEEVMYKGNHISFILSYAADTLAEQFTLIERDLLQQLDWKELIDLTWDEPLEPYSSWIRLLLESHNKTGINIVTLRFNLMTNWIISEILLSKELNARVLTLSKFIHIAKKCKDIQNYATMFQITLALGSDTIKGLKKTWSGLDSGDLMVFKKLKELTSSNLNFFNFRTEFETITASKGVVPFTPLELSDLTANSEKATILNSESSQVEFQEEEVYELVNMEKFRISCAVLRRLLRAIDWSNSYDFKINDDILSKCLYISCLSEEEMEYCRVQLINP